MPTRESVVKSLPVKTKRSRGVPPTPWAKAGTKLINASASTPPSAAANAASTRPRARACAPIRRNKTNSAIASPISGPRLWVSTAANNCSANIVSQSARCFHPGPATMVRASATGITSSSIEARKVGLPMVPPGRAALVPTARPSVRKKSKP